MVVWIVPVSSATLTSLSSFFLSLFFFFNVPATTEIYTLSLHAALPILAPPLTPPLAPPTEGSLIKDVVIIGKVFIRS